MEAWVLLALLSSLCFAGYISISKYADLPTNQLLFGRSVLLVALCSIVLAMSPVWDWQVFWGACIIGVCVLVGDRVLFTAAAQYGGRLVSLFQVLKIAVLFPVWLLLDVQQRIYIWQNPLLLLGVISVFAIMAWAVLTLRQHGASRAALWQVLPAGIIFAGADALAALLALNIGNWPQLAFFLLWCHLVVLLGLSIHGVRQRQLRMWCFSGRTWQFAGLCVCIFVPMTVSFLVALGHAPNPAYVNAIGLLGTVWITVYMKARGRDASNWLSMFALAGAAALLVIITA